MSKIIIGITDCSKYYNYENWFVNEPDVELIRLSYSENNFDEIKKCNSILLTGGQDVHPRFYNKPGFISYSKPNDIDEIRDEFEFKVLEFSQTNNLPVLGICRGLQVANVFFGGTLIPDIVTSGKPDHTRIEQNDRYHAVEVNPSSLLHKIVGIESGEVNSSHHQSADKIADELIANCFSEDGIVEGLERKETEDKPYLMLVQWHPERMSDQENVFAKKLKQSFLETVRKNQN